MMTIGKICPERSLGRLTVLSQSALHALGSVISTFSRFGGRRLVRKVAWPVVNSQPECIARTWQSNLDYFEARQAAPCLEKGPGGCQFAARMH